jgi:hypothetical protein
MLPKKVGSVYSCVKTTIMENSISQSAATPVWNQYPVALNPNGADFTSLAAVFDQYRIPIVEMTFTPHSNSSSGTAPSSGQLLTVIDYDDSLGLGSIAAAVAYADCVSSPTYKMQRRCFRPRVAVAAYSTAFTSYANLEAQWIDCSSPLVAHYGIKAIADTGTAGSLVAWDVIIRCYFEFRSTR